MANSMGGTGSRYKWRLWKYVRRGNHDRAFQGLARHQTAQTSERGVGRRYQELAWNTTENESTLSILIRCCKIRLLSAAKLLVWSILMDL
jgi:hypothetical protein